MLVSENLLSVMPQGAIKKKSTAAKLNVKARNRQSGPKKGRVIRPSAFISFKSTDLLSAVKYKLESILVKYLSNIQ